MGEGRGNRRSPAGPKRSCGCLVSGVFAFDRRGGSTCQARWADFIRVVCFVVSGTDQNGSIKTQSRTQIRGFDLDATQCCELCVLRFPKKGCIPDFVRENSRGFWCLEGACRGDGKGGRAPAGGPPESATRWSSASGAAHRTAGGIQKPNTKVLLFPTDNPPPRVGGQSVGLPGGVGGGMWAEIRVRKKTWPPSCPPCPAHCEIHMGSTPSYSVWGIYTLSGAGNADGFLDLAPALAPDD